MTVIHKAQLKRDALSKIAAAAATDFTAAAQRIALETDLTTKKVLLNELILEQFKYPKKVNQFRAKLEKCTKPSCVDKIAWDLVLYQQQLGVIK